jgi:hypothetical protein
VQRGREKWGSGRRRDVEEEKDICHGRRKEGKEEKLMSVMLQNTYLCLGFSNVNQQK